MDGPAGHYPVVFSLDRPPLLVVIRRPIYQTSVLRVHAPRIRRIQLTCVRTCARPSKVQRVKVCREPNLDHSFVSIQPNQFELGHQLILDTHRATSLEREDWTDVPAQAQWSRQVRKHSTLVGLTVDIHERERAPSHRTLRQRRPGDTTLATAHATRPEDCFEVCSARPAGRKAYDNYPSVQTKEFRQR